MSAKRRVYPDQQQNVGPSALQPPAMIQPQTGYGPNTFNPPSTPSPFINQNNILPPQTQNVPTQNTLQRQTPFASSSQNNPPQLSQDKGLQNQPPMNTPPLNSVLTQSNPHVHPKHRVYFPADPEEQNLYGHDSYSHPQTGLGQVTDSMGQLSLNNPQGFLQQEVAQPGYPQQGHQPQGYVQQTGFQQTYQQQAPQYQTQHVEAFTAPAFVTSSMNCPPPYIKMTLSHSPDSQNLVSKCGIPFGCIIHPLAKPTSEEERIPVVNFGATGIVRCRRCRSYINPFVTFTDSGRRWRCNLCNLPNDVPGDYFCPVDAAGRRTDVNERPELSRGFVEFIAPSEYMVRPPMPPTYFFVIDVSYYSITSGMLQVCVDTIKGLLDQFPGNPRTRIGFITFDSTVHFYNLKSSLSQPQMLVVTDIDDVFVPLNEDLLVNLQESKTVVETLLTKMPTMFKTTQNVETVLGVALKAAFDVIHNIGGKILVFASHMPGTGLGKLINREDTKLLGTDKEVSLLLPDNDYYKNFSLDCSRQQVSVDLFLFSANYTDVASLGCLSQFTGGEVFYYPNFRADRDGEKFYHDLTRDITRETGWEAVMRVRTSRGVKVHAHYGNFFIRSTDLLALPNVDADKAFGVQLSLSETLATKYITIQTALLYTTSKGERRIRVFTNCLPVTNSLHDLFKGADIESVFVLTTKMAIEKALTTRLSDAREALVNKCIDILGIYRTDVATQSSLTSQLLLPDSLKLFPLYILALIKHIALRGATDVRPDERTYYMGLLRTLPIPETIVLVYPRLFRIDNITEEMGVTGPNGEVVLPPSNNLSSEKLDRTGAFLLEDGHTMFLWVGRAVSPSFLQQVLGVSSLENVDTTQLKVAPQQNAYSARVIAIINELQSQRSNFMTLCIIKEGEARESKFFSYFVEDRTKSIHSYYEFLVNLHQRIQAKLSKK